MAFPKMNEHFGACANEKYSALGSAFQGAKHTVDGGIFANEASIATNLNLDTGQNTGLDAGIDHLGC